jgi:hypothetical protein
MKQVFEFIKQYVSYGTAIGSIVVGLWVVFVFVNDMKLTSTKVDILIQSDSLKANTQAQIQRDINSIKYDIQDITDSQKSTNEQLSKFKSSYVKRLSNDKSLTKEEFIQYMDGLYNDLDLKKNEMNYIENDSLNEIALNTK